MVKYTQTWNSYLNKMSSSRTIIKYFQTLGIGPWPYNFFLEKNVELLFSGNGNVLLLEAMLFIMDIDDILMIVCDIWYPVGSLKTSLHGCSYFTLDEKKL